MKKINTALKNASILVLIALGFIGCEKDFSTLGTEVVGGSNFVTTSEEYPVITYNKSVGPVRTDGLPINYLGIYNDPIYGTTTASYVSQMKPSVLDPSFGTEVVLDSVVLTIPYFSTTSETDDDGNAIYTLDSIFGESPMKISAFRNNYYLRDFDPDSNFEETQKYYSNGTTSQTGMISMSELEGDLLYDSTEDFPSGFVPSSNPNVLFVINDEDEREESSREVPALRVVLDNDYWQELIIDKEGEIELSNAANFENYFRGIYFKVEPVNGDLGTMMLLDFRTDANITLYYTKDGVINDTGSEPTRDQSTFSINFSGNRVNFLDNNYNFPLEDGDAINGDQNLFLKGAVGSTAVVNLFNGDDLGESSEFTTFKEEFVETDADGNFVKSKRLVNEANLIFYVDQSMVNGEEEPDRVYLYDLDNKQPLLDYFLDPSTNNFSPVDTKILHLGPLERVDEDDPESEGVKYRIKITEHINNLLLRDSTNIKFGLSVAGNLNLESGVDQYDVITDDTNLLDKLPLSAITTPRGTVLYGSNATDDTKKVRLEIFYTEPNN